MALREFFSFSPLGPRLLLGLVVACAPLAWCGCDMQSLRPTVRTAATDEVPGATKETADAAARKFFAAVAKKDIDAAVQCVISVDREKARKELANPPKLPEELLLLVYIKGNKARIKCANEGFETLGLKLIFIDNEWWVTL